MSRTPDTDVLLISFDSRSGCCHKTLSHLLRGTRKATMKTTTTLDVSDTSVTISVEGFTGEQILDALFSALSQRVTSGYGPLPLEESITDAIEVREITMCL